MTTYSVSVSESFSLLEKITGATNNKWFTVASESISLGETDSSLGSAHGTVAEFMSLVDHANLGSFNVSVSEQLGIIDGPHPSIRDTISYTIGRTTVEALSLASSQSGYVQTTGNLGTFNLTVAESMTLADIDVDPETFTSVGLNFWGYKWAYDAGIQKLAVYCAGLDLGDWPVGAQGQVFVPWQVDADQLFTPGFLINMSAQLSGDVPDNYGATAVNIDLHTNTGDIVRVVVDCAIGVPYTSRLQLLRPNATDMTHSQYGPSLGETRRIHQFSMLLTNAQGLKAGTELGTMRSVEFRHPSGAKYPTNRLYTGVFWHLIDAEYNFDNQLTLEVSRPWPTTLVALEGFLKTADRE